MLSGAQFYDVLCAVVPLYVALFLGYGSLKWWGVVTPEQSAGISRFNALVAMPPLVFEIIAFNDPYTMDNKLIAAYCLSNGVVLVALFAWMWYTKRSDGLDWVITLFQVSVMPNTIIVGIPVLSPLYSITGSGIAAIFIGQVLWLYPVLFLYELRAVKKLGQPVLGHASAQAQAHAGAQNAAVTAPVNGHPHVQNGIPALMTEAEHEDCRIKIGDETNKPQVRELQMGNGSDASRGHVEDGNMTRESDTRDRDLVESDVHTEEAASTMKKKEMAIRVGKKLVCLPLTYSTLLGIIYSLIAGRWHFGPPRILRNSLDIIGRITLGLTMYTIGNSTHSVRYHLGSFVPYRSTSVEMFKDFAPGLTVTYSIVQLNQH
ncbi:hypothetical protein KC19_2G266000 [Ceratodon purpureus]|uniref:PIN-like protein n=1 Tax=Ceratodon purpureus TaxID=3225 RepID=A0A8T0IZF8_CERPU|nr:hypothetical protein KC19_2G266000 [Ceratodon purpureus]